MKRGLVLLALLALVAGYTFAGGGSETAAAGKKMAVGILMPTKEQTTWTFQGESLTKGFKHAGYDVFIEYAEDDPSKQIMQIENMITKGVKALVIAAVDNASLTDCCEKAKEEGIMIVADDRLISNTAALDYYVTFDLTRMGEFQGQYIADSLDLKSGKGPFTLEIFSGSQDDTNSISFYNGAMDILKQYIDNGQLVVKSGQIVYPETAIQSWDSSKAQNRMDNLLSGYYANDHLDAVLVAADCLALGVISSLESMGYGKGNMSFPVITGQDAELANIKYILAGKQSMTAFLDANKVAEIVVPVVEGLINGQPLEPMTYYDNGVKKIPTRTYDPYLIDQNNVDYLVNIGYFTADQIKN